MQDGIGHDVILTSKVFEMRKAPREEPIGLKGTHLILDKASG
jgi:hypothetical protein